MTASPNGSVFNRAHIDVGALLGNGLYAYCGCHDCTTTRANADWTGYVPSIPRRAGVRVGDVVTIDKVPVGATYILEGLDALVNHRIKTVGGGYWAGRPHDTFPDSQQACRYEILKLPEPEVKIDPYTQPVEPAPNSLVTIGEIPVGATYSLIGRDGTALETRRRIEGGGEDVDTLEVIAGDMHDTAAVYRVESLPPKPEAEPVRFGDLAEGAYFSNANEPATLFIKRRTPSRYGLREDTTAVWVADPDGAGHAGKGCYIDDDREVIPREVSFQFD